MAAYNEQEIQTLKLKDLVLWTENPRDPIDSTAKDQDIVDKATSDPSSKWTLPKLAKEMGEYYDLSELPTVVFHGKKPVVYDGNRRMILGKIKHGYAKGENFDISVIPSFPEEIPCNVCSKDIALKNVLRKHGDSGSWQPLERDIFLNKFMKQPKSTFLILEENTSIITARPHLNQGFVKTEIFREESLKEMGFEIKGEKLYSVHSDKQALSILNDLSDKIENKKITTRINRGKVLEVLDKKSQQLIDHNKENDASLSKLSFVNGKKTGSDKAPRQSKRKTKKEEDLFGGKLYLKIGGVSDLYRDIVDLYEYYLTHRATLSQSFPGLIRMALRLLCETAANDSRKSMDSYLKSHFGDAKKNLDQNVKTTLAAQNVTEASIVQHLHTGAHQYKSTNNLSQTLALSIIIGQILKISHGKEI